MWTIIIQVYLVNESNIIYLYMLLNVFEGWSGLNGYNPSFLVLLIIPLSYAEQQSMSNLFDISKYYRIGIHVYINQNIGHVLCTHRLFFSSH